jgi:hypothetical protein
MDWASSHRICWVATDAMIAKLRCHDWHLAILYIQLVEFSVSINITWVLNDSISGTKSAHFLERTLCTSD